MNIDRMEFLAWMERIMDRFDMIGDRIDALKKKRNSIDGEELLDNQDLMQMLRISPRSLQRYRSPLANFLIIPYPANFIINYPTYINLSERVLTSNQPMNAKDCL